MSQIDPEQWGEIQRLFQRAAELPAGSRARFLEQECADERLRREVQSLLDFESSDLSVAAKAIVAEAAAVVREADPDKRLIGAHLGPYKIEKIVGHGGMGAVYHAHRDDGEFRQQVAIKLVRAAAQSPATMERFKQERQILARLAHPNIARLLGGGSTPDRVPYLVMEFLQGKTITAWCKSQTLTVEQRLRLFLSVCEGVEFAHRNRVVHRDLKPANILVTAEGTPKLLDFGIAKMLAPDAQGAAETTLGAAALTPEYAAPEQVRGDPVSEAADIYALGLVLYEMLTERKAQDLPDRTPATLMRIVCHSEPATPATLKPELAGDLDNIIRMAIRKEPERRYGSVAALARDIRLHLEGRPVIARPDTLTYRAAKFLQRNRAAVGGALVGAMVFGGITLTYWVRTPDKTPRVLRMTQITQTGHVEPNGLATDGSQVYFIEGAAGRSRLARVSVDGGIPQLVLNALEDPGILDISPDHSRVLLSKGLGADVPLWELRISSGALRRIGDIIGHTAAWSPDGETIAFARGSTLFKVNNDGTGLRKLIDTPGKPQKLRWSPQPGSQVLRFTIRAPDGHEATLWELQSGGMGLHPVLTAEGSGAGTAISNDDGIWISGGRYYLFRSLSASGYSIRAVRERGRFPGLSGEHTLQIHQTTSSIQALAPGPDGKRVYFISAQERRQLVRYNNARREFVPYLPGISGRWVAYSRDGKWVAYTTSAPETLWRSRPDGSDAVQLTQPPLRAFFPSWSADGAWIAFTGFPAGQTYGIYVIPSTGGIPQRLTPADSADDNPEWSPDGNRVMFHHSPPRGIAGPNGIYVIDWNTRKISPFMPAGKWHRGAWSPDGQHIAMTDGSQIDVLDARSRQLTHVASAKGIGRPLWSHNGRYVYYQDLAEAELPIFRAAIEGGRVERLMSLRQIPQSDLSAYILVSLAPDDTPIASILRTNSEVYALDLELP